MGVLARHRTKAVSQTTPWISVKAQRRLVSKAFTPRSTARLKTTIAGVITELVDPVTTAGRCDVVADIERQYPIPIISGLLGAPRQDWQLFSDWADDIFKVLTWNVANDAPVIMAAHRLILRPLAAG